MDPVTGVAAMATSLSAVKASQDLGIAVLRKERDATTAAALLLIQNLDNAGLPPHLGRNVNIAV